MWCGLTIPDFNSTEELLVGLEAQLKSSTEKKIGVVVGVAVIAQLWNNRNEATFNGKFREAAELFAKAQGDVLLWLNSRAKKLEIDRSSWIINPFLACKML